MDSDDEGDGWPDDGDMSLQNLGKEDSLRDFTIAAETGKEWRVHKLVLYIHSNVLYRMSTSSDFVECQTGRAVLKDVEGRSVEAMIDYFYSGNIEYPDPNEDSNVTTYPEDRLKDYATYFLEAWHLADMYNIRGMQREAVRAMLQPVIWNFEMNFAKRFVDVLAELDGVPEKAWQPLTRTFAIHLSDSHTSDVGQMKELFNSHPEFAARVLNGIVERNHRVVQRFSPLQDDGGW